jgi:V/A-type H+-transporting ATPase subunit E
MSNREAFENVVGKVAKDVQSEIKSSLEEAYNDALQIISSAEKEAIAKANEIPHSKERQAETLRRRIIGNAELKARNLSLQVLEETVNKIFDESLKEMEEPSSMKDYGKALKKFLEEGVEAIGGEEFIAVGRSADKDILKKASQEVEKERNVKIKTVSETLDSRGGVQVKNSDGSVIYDNTIEARLERLKPLLRKQISEILTGQG